MQGTTGFGVRCVQQAPCAGNGPHLPSLGRRGMVEQGGAADPFGLRDAAHQCRRRGNDGKALQRSTGVRVSVFVCLQQADGQDLAVLLGYAWEHA